MSQITEKLLLELNSIKNNGKITVENIDDIINSFVKATESFVSESDKQTFDQIKNISDQIKESKVSIVEPGADVGDAKLELDAVIKSTEDATDTILDSAEKIQSLLSSITNADAVKVIGEEVTKIFEACNFQDITGQRINKVMATLNQVEGSVGTLMDSFASKAGSVSIDEISVDELKNGPQLQNDAPSQDDVDKLFDGS